MLTRLDTQTQIYQVVHPLDDVPEEKCSPEKLGAIHMTPTVKLSLLALRGYLILIIAMVFFSVLHQAGLFAH
jgi:hypothetical protein